MITGGFGVSVLLGDDGHPRARHWYVRADGVKRWADNDQPCEQPGGNQCHPVQSWWPSDAEQKSENC